MTADVSHAPCALCQTESDLSHLISMAGYPVCKPCLESLASDVGVPVRRFAKVREGRQIAGVCGGLADYANMDRDTFRTIAVLACFFTAFAPLIIAYLVLAFVLPTES